MILREESFLIGNYISCTFLQYTKVGYPITKRVLWIVALYCCFEFLPESAPQMDLSDVYMWNLLECLPKILMWSMIEDILKGFVAEIMVRDEYTDAKASVILLNTLLTTQPCPKSPMSCAKKSYCIVIFDLYVSTTILRTDILISWFILLVRALGVHLFEVPKIWSCEKLRKPQNMWQDFGNIGASTSSRNVWGLISVFTKKSKDF